MTLKLFIQTIKEVGRVPKSQDDIVIELYRYSGLPVSESTAVESRKGRRAPKYDQKPINEAGFIQYFNMNTISTWTDMQEAFSALDEYGIIDTKTKDAETFYKSLLTMFYLLLKIVPVTLRCILPERPLLIGRETELTKISDAFELGNYVVLTGIGGIGKSQIALAYAHTINDLGGWIVQHVVCEDSESLRDAVMKLQFDGLKEVKKSKKDADEKNLCLRIECLKKRQQNVLIILDNLNRPFSPDDRSIFKSLTECGSHIRILLTSRAQLADDKRHIVHISPLETDSLLALYEYYRFTDNATHENYINGHTSVLEKIFDSVGQHTLMVILLAKLSANNLLTEDIVYRLLEESRVFWEKNAQITKDGTVLDASIIEIVKQVFCISCLSDTEKKIMRYMSIMPFGGIRLTLFEKLTGCSRRDIINLKNRHWIMVDEELLTLRLHPIICEAMLSMDEIRPSFEACRAFIRAKRVLPGGKSDWQVLNQISACVASRIAFREIQDICISEESSIRFFDHLKDEDKETLLYLNRVMKDYANQSF